MTFLAPYLGLVLLLYERSLCAGSNYFQRIRLADAITVSTPFPRYLKKVRKREKWLSWSGLALTAVGVAFLATLGSYSIHPQYRDFAATYLATVAGKRPSQDTNVTTDAKKTGSTQQSGPATKQSGDAKDYSPRQTPYWIFFGFIIGLGVLYLVKDWPFWWMNRDTVRDFCEPRPSDVQQFIVGQDAPDDGTDGLADSADTLVSDAGNGKTLQS